jgi:hypothetical protein
VADLTPERPRCGAPCLKHAHGCDRSPKHTGFHRDVQQKGDHTCTWDTPGPKDFAAVMAALRNARVEVERLQRDAAAWRTSYDRLSGRATRLWQAWQSARRGRAQMRAERDAARAELTGAYLGATEVREMYADLRKRATEIERQRDRLAAQVKRIRDLHAEFKIYDECGHRHSEDDPGVIEIENVGLTCKDGYQYSVCRTCCRDGDYQSLACVEHHDHTDCHPCHTIRALDGTEAGR